VEEEASSSGNIAYLDKLPEALNYVSEEIAKVLGVKNPFTKMEDKRVKVIKLKEFLKK
jgi:hypothetical protein